MSYIKEELEHLKKSFSFKKHNFLALAYDALLFLILIGFSYFFIRLILNIAFSENPLIDFKNGASFQMYTSLILGTILFLFIFSAIYTLFKYLLWNNFLEQNFHKKSYVKYYFYHLGMFILLIVLQILLARLNIPGLVAAVLLGFLFVHFHTYFHLHYIKHKSIKDALKIAFKKGLSVHEFIFVYVITAILIYLYLFLFVLMNQKIAFFITPILLILMFFWLRNYFSKRHEF